MYELIGMKSENLELLRDAPLQMAGGVISSYPLVMNLVKSHGDLFAPLRNSWWIQNDMKSPMKSPVASNQ